VIRLQVTGAEKRPANKKPTRRIREGWAFLVPEALDQTLTIQPAGASMSPV
jgi:hypothetical protein